LNSLNNTVFVGKVFTVLNETASTNAYALALLNQAPPPAAGTVIYTDTQTAGRGQRGTKWRAEAGKNIALSIILYPRHIRADGQFGLSMAVALGVCKFVQEAAPQLPVCIKWPNDIYIGNQKVAGILIENTVQGGLLASSVVGIGVNVNQTDFGGLPNATSLCLAAGQQFELIGLVQKLCSFVETAYLALQPDKMTAIKRQYLQNLYQFGQMRRFKRPDDLAVFEARITDVLNNGLLQLTYPDAVTENFDLKQLVWVD